MSTISERSLGLPGSAGLSDLNPEQREAATYTESALLIIAGAGTGKTRVMAHRIAYMISAQGVAPARVLGLTFTNKAAGELRERVAGLTGVDPHSLSIGTFHWLGHRILRRYGSRGETGSDFTLLTPSQSLRILRLVVREAYPDNEQPPLPIVRDTLRALRNGRSGPDQLATSNLYAAYRRALRREKALDLDDLVLEPVRLLEKSSSLRRRLAEYFVHIVVDEYQDTNLPQIRLLQLLAAGRGNIAAVGDDDQAIYGWRQADAGSMMRFKTDFPNPRLVRLETNYRSTGRILIAANELLRNNRERLGKNLRPVKGAGRKPQLFAGGDQASEAEFVCGRIDALLKRGLAPSDIAVLYRTNVQSRPIEDQMVRSGIPYEVLAGRRFYERPEVARILDGLRVVSDPDTPENWRQLLLWLPGFGEVRAARVAERLGGRGASSTFPDTRNPLLDTLFRELHAVTPDHSVASSVKLLNTVLERLCGRVGNSAADLEASSENIRELMALGSEFDSRRSGTATEFLDQVALSDPALMGGEAVQLLTLHRSKGLEFEAVFVVGMEERLLPHRRALEQGTPAIEEERRLLYVGMTRARTHLALSYARGRLAQGPSFPTHASRFLDEIPQQMFDIVPERDGARRPRLTHVVLDERVRHLRWGSGVVRRIEGRGRGTIVTLNFDDGRSRRVQLCYAPLERIS